MDIIKSKAFRLSNKQSIDRNDLLFNEIKKQRKKENV